MGNPREPPKHPSLLCAFEDISRLRVFARCPNDPVFAALEARGAARVPPRKLRMLNGVRDLDAPLEGVAFEVQKIAPRVAGDGQRAWRFGVRRGPFASGQSANSMLSPQPDLRRLGVCEILDVLSAPGQVGYPTSMNTDAGLGFPPRGTAAPNSRLPRVSWVEASWPVLRGTPRKRTPGRRRYWAKEPKWDTTDAPPP